MMNPILLYNGKETRQTVDLSLYKQAINIYEVVRIQQGVILFAEDHFQRFCNSLKIGGQTSDTSFETWVTQIYGVVELNKIENANIRIDRFYEHNGLFDEIIHPITSVYPTDNQLKQGVTTHLQHAEREHPNAKITNSNLRTKANDLIASGHLYETILVNQQHQITEGSRSNIFFIKDHRLITASDEDVLQGIMRKKVIEAARQLQIHIQYLALPVAMINEIDGAFITGTSPRVLPICQINETSIGVNHPFLGQLRDHIEQMVRIYIGTHPK